tara:strand:- start:66153 stop:67073 length:921 start_codon:yes stop_codon:yes gene_type:complete
VLILPRNFIDLDTFDPAELRSLVQCAKELKNNILSAKDSLAGKTLAMIFEKPSTRTRISFDVAMSKLGGRAVALSPSDLQLGRGESLSDTAQVLSRYVDAIVLRTSRHNSLEELAAASSIPVINGLTDRTHPCQLLADILTFEEHVGPISGKKITWLGDGNNVAATWIQAAAQFNFDMQIGCPDSLRPQKKIVDWARSMGATIEITEDPIAAVKGAHCVVTDTWVSLSDEQSKSIDLLKPFQVDSKKMEAAADGAIFMHCLPAKRGQEVTEEVLEGAASVIFDEAENRLHVQKAILLWCLAPDGLF